MIIKQNDIEKKYIFNRKCPVHYSSRLRRHVIGYDYSFLFSFDFLTKYKHYIMRKKYENKEKIREELQRMYFKKLGIYPDLVHPKSFTEKILWSKINIERAEISSCCDKFKLKEYVSLTIGDKYVVPTYRCWDSVNKISFKGLPNKFMLKVNWSSGYNIAIDDFQNLCRQDLRYIKNKLYIWTRPESNSFYASFNAGYKYVSAVIYAEQMLEDNFLEQEYKIFCFGGKVAFILIEIKSNGKYSRVCVDDSGNKMKFVFGTSFSNDSYYIPYNIKEMIEVAEKLAKPFAFVRVDEYASEDRIYIGEMTFYSGGGFSTIYPREYDQIIGDYYPILDK